jgi:hypothetical protein
MPRERNLVPLILNNNGGYYQPGHRYDFRTKMEVATIFADLWQVIVFLPFHNFFDSAKVAKVGWKYAAKVVDEISIFLLLLSCSATKIILKMKRYTKYSYTVLYFLRKELQYILHQYGV